MIPNIEDVDEVLVGKTYIVPTVVLNFGPVQMRVVPVIGPLHEDKEFIDFPWRHYHPDRRFVPQAWFDYYAHHDTAHWNVVYSFQNGGLGGKMRDTGLQEGGRRRRVCRRLALSFMNEKTPLLGGQGVPWLPKLEAAYKDEKLREKMICPHRGISCVGVIAESDGGVVCPGHGLKWNPKDGGLMSRCGQDLQRSFL